MRKQQHYFTGWELCLYASSVLLITVSFFRFDRSNPLSLLASLVGVSSLILCAKGNPIGQILMLLFSLLYSVISYSFSYYGELATYLGMTAPMAVIAFIEWMRNPYAGRKNEVKVREVGRRELVVIAFLTLVVTALFYWILYYFRTANLLVSTLSVATSFFAAALTMRRSPYFAFAYAINDLVLISLWILAALEEVKYLSVVFCFVAFFVNDLYCFVSWKRMYRRQNRISDVQ